MNKAETLALFAQGKEAWNEWAGRMLAERKALEEKGEWSEGWPKNDATEAWHCAARADFTGHCFTQEADFSAFVFLGEADFSPVESKNSAGKNIMIPTRFEMAAKFDEATFSEAARFVEATFLGKAVFNEATFSGHAAFDGATFSGKAGFFKATFSEYTVFRGATFSGTAWFAEATFSGEVEFSGATFSRIAMFNVAKFSMAADFDEVTFSMSASFFKAAFSWCAGFQLTRFEGYTNFDQARFEKVAGFVAIEGKSFFSLRRVTFKEAPEFEQAHFSEAPMLDASRFPDKAVPGTSPRWRALKRLAVQGHDHEREQFFFAQELKSLRGETDWLLPRPWNLFRGAPVWQGGARYWLGLGYQCFSDFGRSMALPVVWWGVLTAFFALVYLGQHLPEKHLPYAPRLMVWQANGYTPPLECAEPQSTTPLASAIFLAFHRGSVAGLGGSEKIAQAYACLYGEERGAPLIPDAVAFAGMAQTLLSAPLIFLFLLSVRNHFRIK